MKAARTRAMILQKAAPVFNQKGFDGTSMADLEAITGLTKGALYGNFRDKESLAEEVFRFSIGNVKDRIRQELKTLKSNKKQLLALLDFYARYVLEPPIAGGCPLLNTAVEADDHRKTMRKAVATELLSTVEFITSLLKNGIRSGEFIKDINPKELAYTFFCSIEGAIMFSRVVGSCEPMDIVVKHCKIKLDQISNPLCKNG